ncbi:cation diffusion facilitator family transporter [Gemella cuniculi]|uniref:cation diffusion facilitator family transporter n=1 Tax=Gemella cuniculi TaxID=150240 RepID=UPI000414BD13|nr:cation diffusion facilitator family transporter [Gemella cuniculi]
MNNSIFENLKKAEQGAKLSIFSYLFLTLLKLGAGVFFKSSALVADGINNATDVISSICVLIGLKISRKPADEDHLYGHFRAELISTLVASFIMLYAGIEVIIYAIKKILTHSYEQPNILSAAVAFIASFLMFGVYFYNIRLSKKLGSKSLKAAALDNLSDALVSVGTVVGIIATYLGFPIADSIVAIIVGFLIVWTAVSIFKESTHVLTDGVETETIEKINDIVESTPDVISIIDIKGRTHGLLYFIDITITVNPKLNVKQSHDITIKIEKALAKEFYYCETLIHLEPHGIECHPSKTNL